MSGVCDRCTRGSALATGGPESLWAVVVDMPFWPEEKGGRNPAFKGRAGNLQVEEKEQTSCKQVLAGPPRDNGPEGSSRAVGAAGAPLSATEFRL